MDKQKWIAHALDSGFESFEISQGGKRERSYTWFEGKMDTFVTSRVLGTALRGVMNGKMVNYATEDLSDDAMEQVIASMKEQAGAITSDDAGIIRSPLPIPASPASEGWVKPSAEEIRELLADIERRVKEYDPRIFMVMREGWTEETSSRSIVNSRGLAAEDTGTVQVLSCGAAAREGSEVKNEYRTEIVRDIRTFDRAAFVEKLCTDVLHKLGASGLASGSYPVIFEAGAMTTLFTAFSSMFSGELISKGISPLRDSLGTAVFSEQITVTDDPLNPAATVTYAFDDEGCPACRKKVVDRGVFKTVLHSTMSAARMHAESTGNAFKASYASALSVRPMNCCIEPGEKTLEELCHDMKDGLVITSLAGIHAGINPVTTDFSLQCSGYLVKDGVRDRSVTLITVAGNFLELMKHVTAVGSDLDWNYRTIVTPSIAFESAAVSGE